MANLLAFFSELGSSASDRLVAIRRSGWVLYGAMVDTWAKQEPEVKGEKKR